MLGIVGRAVVRRVLLFAGLAFAVLAAGSALANTTPGHNRTPANRSQGGVQHATSWPIRASGALPAGSPSAAFAPTGPLDAGKDS